MRLLRRFVVWFIWQLFVLFLFFVVWANAFGEYGLYTQPTISSITAIIFFVVAVYVGTVVPLHRWRMSDRQDDNGDLPATALDGDNSKHSRRR